MRSVTRTLCLSALSLVVGSCTFTVQPLRDTRPDTPPPVTVAPSHPGCHWYPHPIPAPRPKLVYTPRDLKNASTLNQTLIAHIKALNQYIDKRNDQADETYRRWKERCGD